MAIGLLGGAALLLVQRQQIGRLAAENADLRAQLAQAAYMGKNAESSSERSRAAVKSAQADRDELLRLRGQAVRLRQLEQENAQLKLQRERAGRQMGEALMAVASPGQPLATSTSDLTVRTGIPPPDTTDLGMLELQDRVAASFDLGGGTNCVVTPTDLSDGKATVQITVGLTNGDGTVSELATSLLTARPGQHCSISVGDRTIALAVKLKPQ